MTRGACYDSQEIGMPVDYSATISEFINEYTDKVKNKEDIIWAVCHNDYMTDRDLRLFAVWCVREALKLVDPDPRSVEACNVAERFANGNATDEELAAAWAAAWDATRAAARAAARDAARAAAWAAAWDAQIDQLLPYFK